MQGSACTKGLYALISRLVDRSASVYALPLLGFPSNRDDVPYSSIPRYIIPKKEIYSKISHAHGRTEQTGDSRRSLFPFLSRQAGGGDG